MTFYTKVALLVGTIIGIHFLSNQFMNQNFNITSFVVSYLSQAVLSLLILFILFKIDKKAKEQLGYVFLGLTSAKVILSYFIATHLLFLGNVIPKEVKINFFIVFLFFLCLDTYFVIKLLNKK